VSVLLLCFIIIIVIIILLMPKQSVKIWRYYSGILRNHSFSVGTFFIAAELYFVSRLSRQRREYMFVNVQICDFYLRRL